MTNKNNTKSRRNKKERIVPYVLVFDVDGVLTHPSEKKITEPDILSHLTRNLEAGTPIILNTGRSADFIIKDVLVPLEHSVKDKNILNNIYSVGEKGAVNISYNNNAQKTISVDQSISVPETLQAEAKNIVANKFSDIAFYDSTKKTMISVDMLDKISVEEFTIRQEKLNEEFTNLLKKHDLLSDYKVDPSRIATDIENKHVGKGLGIQKGLAWLDEKNIRSKKFIAFGDSKSDIDMAIELNKRNLPVEFVFVGEKDQIDETGLKFPVIYTKSHCEAGTIEYLTQFML
jgi:hydroxymethylpyrimidine pyrophosphatase-like HAD family hydrolase